MTIRVYVVKTKAPRGPRSFASETFVVKVAATGNKVVDASDAGEKARKSAYPNAKVSSIEEIEGDIKRTHIG